MQTVPNLPRLALPRVRPHPRLARLARISRITAVTLLVSYGVLMLFMMGLEVRLVYKPIRADEQWQPPVVPGVQDVWLTTADGTACHGWWYPTAGPDALLFCHGNADNISLRQDSMRRFHDEANVSVLMFDYPGFGRSAGEPTEAGCYGAAAAAYDWLTKTRGIPPERLLIYGESLGGGVAVETARRHDHRAMVLINTFDSLPELAQGMYPFLPVKMFMVNRFESAAKIGECRRPVFVAHAVADRRVPFARSARLYAGIRGPKQFLALEHNGHEDPLPRDFAATLHQFLDRYAPVPPGK